MKKIRAGIIGGAGYTGGELIRLLVNHPAAEIAFVQSRSQVGHLVSSVHRDLLGVTALSFTDDKSVYSDPSLDVVFLAQGHGEARKFLEETKLPPQVRVIDLSQDFRLSTTSAFRDQKFVYGLPELNREKIKLSQFIANPGCFATAVQLALLPLSVIAGGGRRVSVTGITGSTGAGQKPSETTHFSFRANNIQAYKTLTHQHVAEIEESLNARVSFVPWRGDFTRGIFVSAIVNRSEFLFPASAAETLALYRTFYQTHPFISVTNEPIDLKAVVNTNRAHIEINQSGESLVIHAAIDNLLKGASGQAVQNMNLMMGVEETTGLQLKGVAF